jgi:hypothetical protein
MPHLTQQDATQLLPRAALASDLLDHYRDGMHDYAGHIFETRALVGATHDAVVSNAEQIAAAGDRVHAAASRRISGLRQCIELGASLAAEGSAHAQSVDIPGFI